MQRLVIGLILAGLMMLATPLVAFGYGGVDFQTHLDEIGCGDGEFFGGEDGDGFAWRLDGHLHLFECLPTGVRALVLQVVVDGGPPTFMDIIPVDPPGGRFSGVGTCDDLAAGAVIQLVNPNNGVVLLQGTLKAVGN